MNIANEGYEIDKQYTDDDLVLFYATFPNLPSAQKVGKNLINNRLAACVNILPETTAIYRWKEKIETEQETIMLIKTVNEKSEAARDYILDHHPNEIPCLIALRMDCLLYTSPSPRDRTRSRMPSSA